LNSKKNLAILAFNNGGEGVMTGKENEQKFPIAPEEPEEDDWDDDWEEEDDWDNDEEENVEDDWDIDDEDWDDIDNWEEEEDDWEDE